jgi:uncharacterized membrane protein HdeD (DUF308 family)
MMIEEIWLEKFSKNTQIAAVIMMLLGLAGIFLPQFFSLALSYFIGWLLLFAALTQAYTLYHYKEQRAIAWLRPLVNLFLSLVFLLYTGVAIASIGLLLAFYFFTDAFASLFLGRLFKAHGSAIWGVVNALLSFTLGVIILINWPMNSALLVGIFVGITLFFDGLMLLFVSKNIRKG